MVAKKVINRKKTGKNNQEEKRIVVIDQDKVKPNSEAFKYFKRHAGGCGKQGCISIIGKKVIVSEYACPVCVNRCKQAPGDAVSVVKLPSNLTVDTTHRYGPNTFKLHGLPVPRPGHVLGLLGTNGTGKSTGLKILAGRLKPNLGIYAGSSEGNAPEWSDIVAYYRGSDLQNYFKGLVNDKLTIAMKPQLEARFTRALKGKTVRHHMEIRDERKMMDRYARDLDLVHLLDRNVEDLSGGELQRFAVGCTLCRKADVYIFDEISSFLDVKQRLQVTLLIRSLVHEQETSVDEWPGEAHASSKKYVIVVEHDLAILDYMSDFIQCMYGTPGAYGVVTARSRVRNGINQFLAGYIATDNMRFRDHELTFKVTSMDFNASAGGDEDAEEEKKDDGKKKKGDDKSGGLRYPNMSHTRSRKNEKGEIVSQFILHVESGSFRDGECIVLLGENGTGKTTFMELLAGKTREQRGNEAAIGSYDADNYDGGKSKPSLAALGVSYKVQGMNPKFRKFGGTVQQFLEQEINKSLSDRLFRLLVIRALNIEEIFDLPVRSLSGGEMQRLSICVCLGTPALVYLIDEPSAALDCEQRIIAAKVMKRWVVNHLGRSIFLVEHDFVMASAMADRVIVYEGKPGIEATACSPTTLADGFNHFLKNLDVTFRKDPINCRPRINKKNSRIDKIQKQNGEYYMFDIVEGEDDGVDYDDI
uniref:ABC transporter domain-containing protein n=1 Tax=Pseudo-nitzschia australis TaxID=44445 RepID=A0A7S4A9W4_9STRA